MPFGRKAPPGRTAPLIDFDRIWTALAAAIESTGLEPRRADFEPAGGFIHRAMYERLLVAEYVVADLTFGNTNVAYEVGVRHGASPGVTILICAAGETGALPFDLRPLRMIPYEVLPDGAVSDAALASLGSAIRERIELGRRGELANDNPLLQVTGLGPGRVADHEKTDVFLDRMRFVNDTTRQIADAIGLRDEQRALRTLDEIEREILSGADVVAQLHTVLIALLIAYREKEQWARMVALSGKLPRELRMTSVVREQTALALNRLAEEAGEEGNVAGARELRMRALDLVSQIASSDATSETCGIVGRIHKGRYDLELRAGDALAARSALKAAIEAYEEGFRKDPRDYYPGVNAVTLRICRGTDHDERQLARLLPVVRFSVERAPAPSATRPAERYWQAATKLEMACAERDWSDAEAHLETIMGLRDEPWMQSWMYATTAANLRKQCAARAREPETPTRLGELVRPLEKLVAPEPPQSS